MTDDAWLPPDQTPTRKWPVVGERAPSPEALDLDRATLQIVGRVARPVERPVREVIAGADRTLVADLHCVTRWSRRAMTFTGAPLAALLAEAEPLPGAAYVRFVSWSPRGHDTGLPLSVARTDTWLVHAADGAPLAVEHGFPLRTITVGRYLYKSLKWLRRIEVLDAPVLGYWEREDGYHENADPWPGDQRYVTGSVPPEALARFRAATDFAPFRGRTLRGLDLRGWRPVGRDLRGLALKDCDFREADLSACDLRGANLTMARLQGANLRDVDAREADLEGAYLAGADLRGADLRGAFVTAATWQSDGADALVEGADLTGAHGLLERAEAFLARHGAVL